MTSVLVQASNLIIRKGLESIILTNSGLEVVEGASEITTLGERIEALQPDVVLLWQGNEEALLAELAYFNESNAPAVVVLVDNADKNWATEILSHPVQALLPRSATADEIIASIMAAALGLVVVHPDFSEDLFPRTESVNRALPAAPIQALTGREIEVLGMLAQGWGNKTIAKQLGISEHTVKFHISSIFQKLNASSRTEAVTLGARLGLILL